MPTLTDLTVDTPLTHYWNNDGFLILPGVLDEALMSAYENEWQDAHGNAGTELEWAAARKGGWPDPVPYTRHPALAALCTSAPVVKALEELIGEPAGLHLNLTGWVSTERSFHVDSYLNPSHVGEHYAAVWMALDTVHPDSGPFQCVPGSHRWPVVTREKIGNYVNLMDPLWPTHSEVVLEPLYTAEIDRRGAELFTYLPERGDCLIWHPRLVHQGSRPNIPGIQRRAVISHYSGIHHRKDFPPAVQYCGTGAYVFPLGDRASQPVR